MQDGTWHRSLSIAWMRRLCSPFNLTLLPFFIVCYMTVKRLFLSFFVNFLLQRIVSTWCFLMMLHYVSCFFCLVTSISGFTSHSIIVVPDGEFGPLEIESYKRLTYYFVLEWFLIEIIYLNLYDTLIDDHVEFFNYQLS